MERLKPQSASELHGPRPSTLLRVYVALGRSACHMRQRRRPGQSALSGIAAITGSVEYLISANPDMFEEGVPISVRSVDAAR